MMHPTKLFRTLVAVGVCGTLGAPALADAQSDRLQALEKRLEGNAQLIEKLSARIAELERAAKPAPAGAPSAVATPPDQAHAITALQQSVNQISEGMSRRSADTGLPVHGFADVGAAWSSTGDPVKLRGFNGGTLDLYLTPQFGQRVKGLVELAVEYGEDGAAAVDLERLQLGYTVSDAVTLWVGRFHTPYGLWNTAYHHGANLQTSISRPRFLDFEDKGGILPSHSVGAWASGKTGWGGGKITYDAYLANGPRIADSTLDFAAFTDNNSNKMFGANLGYQPSGALSGLTLGLHSYASTVQAYDISSAVMSSTKVRMAGAYVGYDENDWEVMGEYYHFGNVDEDTGKRLSSNARFVQVGKTFGAFTPFVRHEKVGLDPGDNYFRSQVAGRSYERTSLGVRYALDSRSSFKLELSSTSESSVNLIDPTGAVVPFAGRSYRRGAFQYSVAF